MKEKTCKGCSAPVPANRRRCPKCGLSLGGVGFGVGLLLVSTATVAVFLVQDMLDREHSWARIPLRERRARAAALATRSAPDREVARSAPASRPSRTPERTLPARTPNETMAHASPSPMPPTTTVVRDDMPAEHVEPAAEQDDAAPAPAAAKAGPAIPPFRPPAIGSEVAIRLRSGSDMRGTLLALSEQRLEIETPKMTLTLAPAQLAPATRVRFFEADYLRYHELLAEREQREAERRAAATPPKAEKPAKPDPDADPFSAAPDADLREPSSRRSEAADAFFRAF